MYAKIMVATVVAAVLLLPLTAYADDWFPGEIIVKTYEPINYADPSSTGEPEIDALNGQYGVYEIDRVYDDDLLFGGPFSHPRGLWDWNDWLNMVATYEFDTYYVFKYSAQEDPPTVAADYGQVGPVEIAEPDFIGEPELMPNDEYFDYQWYLENSGQFGGSPLADIHATWGWDYFNPSPHREKPILAIIDSGVRLDHEDLESVLIDGYDFGEGDSDPTDNTGHGTRVAGVAGAQVNNSIGIASPGSFPGSPVPMNCFNMMPVKVTDEDHNYSWKAVEGGILWAAKHGADVENISFGIALLEGYPETLEKACRGAYWLGVVVVASKGDQSIWEHHYPSDFKTVIAVTATDDEDNLWEDSNYGPSTECAAPGVDIFTTEWRSWYKYSFFEDPEEMPDGTSFSAALVSAACSIIAGEVGDDFNPPSAKVQAVRDVLYNSCDDVNHDILPGWDYQIGYGRLNLHKMAIELWGYARGDGTVASDTNVDRAASVTLSAPYPNPVRETGTFVYNIDGTVTEPGTLTVYDLTGRKVGAVCFVCAGSGGTVEWDVLSADMPSGVYIARVEAGGTAAAVKFVVVR